MPQPTIAVKDANSVTQTINTINPNGQTTMASSTPVVPASDYVPPLSTNAAQETGGNLATIATNTTNAGTPTIQAGSNIIGKVGIDQTTPGTTNAVSVGSSISSLPLPTGSATASNQTTGNTSLSTIATNTTNAATTTLQTTGNTSLATIATNTTGVATASNQTTANTSLSTIATNTTNAATTTLQTTGNTSLATIATNTTGVATAANQTTANTSLSTIATNTTGVATAANQTSVIGSASAGTAATSSELVGGVYHSAAPTLTTGQQASLQLNASGAVKVDGSATTQPISVVDGSVITGNITVVDSGSTSTPGQYSSSIITGSPTTNSFVSVSSANYVGASVTLAGTWTGTVAFEVSEDGGTSYIARSFLVGGTAQRTGSPTLNGIFSGDVGASTNFRVRATAAITGTVNVSIKLGLESGVVKVSNPISIVDNSSGSSATIKPASTAAAATDTSVVVAISPNQSTLSTQSPIIMSPGEANNISSTGAIAQAQVLAGSTVSLCIQVINITGTATALTSVTTTLGSNTVTLASTTGVQIGQNVIGTGVPIGAFVVSFVSNTSITLNVPCTANGTVSMTSSAGQLVGNWQWSPDGSSWNTLTVLPKTLSPQAATVTTVYSAGLWLVQVPPTGQYVRLNVTTISGLNINAFVDNFQNNSRINLPLFYCNTAVAANYPTNSCFVPPIDTGGLADYSLDMVTLTGTTPLLVPLQSNDGLLQSPFTVVGAPTSNASPANGSNIATINVWWLSCKSKYLTGKFTYSAVTGLNIGGFTAKVNLNEYPIVQAVALTQIGGNAIASASPGGASFGQIVVLGQPASAVEYNSVSWSAASGSGAMIASAIGTAPTYEVNVSSFSIGSSTGLDIFLQASPDAGTTWYDVWQVPAFTAAGTDYIPPINIPGRHRMRWVNRTGAATTATVLVTSSGCSHTAVPQIQFFDRTANLLSGTLNATSATYSTWGCNTLTMWIVLGAATTAGTYQMQVSPDGINWGGIGTATIGTASSTVIATVNNVNARFARIICTLAGSVQTGTYLGLTGVSI